MNYRVAEGITIGDRDLQWRFTRSPGPGGQNVNKVETGVQLRFRPVAHPEIPCAMRKRLAVLAGSRMTLDGTLLLEANRHRTREANRREALERLLDLLRRAAVRPRPRKRTKPTLASRRRRVEDKKKRGEIKRMRRPPGG